MSDWLRELVAEFSQASLVQSEPAASIPDGCARLSVKAVAGGMPDAPIVAHTMKFKRNPACNHVGKCRHTPRHEDVYLPDHKDTHGICMCPPVDVQAHYERMQGVRSKGTPTKRKTLGAERLGAGFYDSSTNIQGSREPGELMQPTKDESLERRLEHNIPYVDITQGGRIACKACQSEHPSIGGRTRRIRCERRAYKCDWCGDRADFTP
jgi:hypothetical protein